MITHPETDKYQELDTMLDAGMLRLYGQLWAAGDNPSDYHLSPLYGDVSQLKNVTLYYGNHEIFYPTLQLFADKLISGGVDVEQIIGDGCGHDYAIMDQEVLKELCTRILEKQPVADLEVTE